MSKRQPTKLDSLEFRDHGKRGLTLLAWVAGILLVGWLTARPAYRLFKTYRAHQMLPAARAALVASRWDDAGKATRLLMAMAPQDPEVLRFVGQYCHAGIVPDGLKYWQLLLATPQGTRADELEYIDYCLALNRLDLAGQRLQALAAATPKNPAVLRLLVRFHQASGDGLAMMARARDWLDAVPDDREAQLVLGEILINQSGRTLRDEGAHLLWGLALANHPESFPAQRLLSRQAWLKPSENRLLLERLEGQKEGRWEAANLRIKMEPGQRARIVVTMAQSLDTTTNLDERIATYAWLSDVQAHGALITKLPPQVAATNATLLSLRFGSLVQLGQAAEADQELLQNTNRFETYLTQCLRARAAAREGHPEEAASFLNTALNATQDRPRALNLVVSYALEAHQPKAALAALLRLMRWPPALLDAGNRATSLARQLGDDKGLYTATHLMAEGMPSQEEWLVLEAYYAVVAGEKPMADSKRLGQLSEAAKSRPWYRSALALVCLKENKPQEALNAFEAGSQNAPTGQERWLAAYAAALGANQQREAARAVVRKLETANLTPGERALIAPWRN